jgi:uncharacterized protein
MTTASRQAPYDNVFALPARDVWLLYAPLRGRAALVNRAAIDNPAALAEALGADPDRPAPHAAVGELAPDFLGLITTRDCNMMCRYCGFGSQSNGCGRMPDHIVLGAVRWMADSVQRRQENLLEVHFFGGEPFAAPDTVRLAVNAARLAAAKRGLQTRFEASTNGCLAPETLAFVERHFAAIVLSIDGPARLHDRTRPLRDGSGSHAWVLRTGRRLRRTPVELCTRTCVTRESAADLAATCAWLCRELAPAALCFEPLQETAASRAAGLEPPSPWAFATAFAAAAKVAGQYNAQAVFAAADTQARQHTFCPVGRDTLIVTPDGTLCACYLPPDEWARHGLDLKFGRVTADGVALAAERVARVRGLTELPPRCVRCFARWHCAGGCHVTTTYPGCDDSRPDFCMQTRLILAWRLLASLDQEALGDSLLVDKEAREALAKHADDRLPGGRHA